MRKETVSQYLLRRLDASAGMHTRIAKESGVAQATISRIYLRKVSPRLDIAEPILAWFDKQDRIAERKKSTSRVPIKASAVVGRAATAATTALRQ
jgi:predicted transcriptional regulator